MSRESLFVHVRGIGYPDIDAVLEDMRVVARMEEDGNNVVFSLEGVNGHPNSWPNAS
jgi:hypothetical protein